MNVKFTRCEHGGSQFYPVANRAWMWVKLELENGESFDCRFEYHAGAWCFCDGENTDETNEITNATPDSLFNDLFNSEGGEICTKIDGTAYNAAILQAASEILAGLKKWRDGNKGYTVNVFENFVIAEDIEAYLSGAGIGIEDLESAEIENVAYSYAQDFASELINN